ncbi:hypothetical protein KIN20_023564 [Parelaphostrongylus tenuis]|uniref:Uncharacterized protein n=1 Tax=Parelaphostrongylus tenuis TaxID=148309 RepID=A0AAD5NA75_PARTN|nr:hypothetical protein KIN20_023564 [Parelaphostrongylus tenuis]
MFFGSISGIPVIKTMMSSLTFFHYCCDISFADGELIEDPAVLMESCDGLKMVSLKLYENWELDEVQEITTLTFD